MSAGKSFQMEINVVIAISKGSNIKYEVDSENWGTICGEDIIHFMLYPCMMAFIEKDKDIYYFYLLMHLPGQNYLDY